jgi:NADH-quinone oxidoreductase subunit L
VELLYAAPVFLPLIGAIIVGFLGRPLLGDRGSQLVACLFMGGAAVTGAIVFVLIALHGEVEYLRLFTWFSSERFHIDWGIRLDALSGVMVGMVSVVSFLIHVYSVGYMSRDTSIPRFMAYLSLFTFFMLALVTSNNFVQLYFGWEGVGLVSYLLIGFWYHKPSANAAAIKAFLVNRVGDFGFGLGILAIFLVFDTVAFNAVFAAAGSMVDHSINFLSMQLDTLTVICILLFIGAMGKSAQIGLHTWLPDAMEGPTPVSALIHAATMVTAGVFMVARCSPLFEYSDTALAVVTIVGGTTCIFAATIAITQNDIKRVIAYSTCSQLGYMFFACGVSAYEAGIFHLTTHAFFKALLFLGAGSVIHAMSDEQDMRKMGGLYKMMPMTWLMMLIGTVALTGVGFSFGMLGLLPWDLGFAGFFSKDAIIEGAFMAGREGVFFGIPAFWIGCVAALLTSFYSWRLIFMTFHGKYRGPKDVYDHAHDPKFAMAMPLVVLAVGAILAGGVFKADFIGERASAFWHDAMPSAAHGEAVAGGHGDDHAEAGDHAVVDDHAAQAGHDAPPAPVTADAHAVVDDHGEAAEGDHGGGHHPPTWVLLSPFFATLTGFGLAIWFYLINEGMGARIAARGGPLHSFLYNKWYVDEIYHFVFVRGAKALGDLFWKIGDVKIIDGLGPNGVAGTTLAAARRLAKGQSGFLYHYAFVMLIGVLGFTLWIMIGQGGL